MTKRIKRKGRKRVRGFLDPLISRMPTGKVKELAAMLHCDRKSIYLWQTRGKDKARTSMDTANRMRIDAIAMSLGLPPIFNTM